jgi:hypothetical protein
MVSILMKKNEKKKKERGEKEKKSNENFKQYSLKSIVSFLVSFALF